MTLFWYLQFLELVSCSRNDKSLLLKTPGPVENGSGPGSGSGPGPVSSSS